MCSQWYNRNRNVRHGLSDADHLIGAAQWIVRAQDATGDGGVAGRYLLRSGWTSSYPETTGYLVPTFLALAARLADSSYQERAARCIEFLRPLQLASGAFPGREVRENRTEPSPFNTAQILCGLHAWYHVTKNVEVLGAARRAADWLVSVQDPDGAFRRHAYLGVASTYTAHASCWLAEFGRDIVEPRYELAAARHLDWVLGHQDAQSGWFDLAGFTTEDHQRRIAVTHTIAYTIAGVLTSSVALNRPDGIEAAAKAARAVARRLELLGWLPGRLDHRWRPAADFACMTGNAQMALIWFRLFELQHDARLVNAALKALDLVKRSQPLNTTDPGIRGGIPGSDPIWGDYIPLALPNWAAKFFIDALLAKPAALERVRAMRGAGLRRIDKPPATV